MIILRAFAVLAVTTALAASNALAQDVGSKKSRIKDEVRGEHDRAAETREGAERHRPGTDDTNEIPGGRTERERERAEQALRDAEGRLGNEGPPGRDNGATRGNDKSQEMRARRDETKAIKDEYRAETAKDRDGTDVVVDTEETGEDQQNKAKKPWWKFWGD